MTNPVPESPGRYTKKPVTIEAMQWDGTAEEATRIIEWAAAAGHALHYWCSSDEECRNEINQHRLRIPTLEGAMLAKAGDWIIKGIKDEFYPCKPDIFAATYGPARPTNMTEAFIPEGLLESIKEHHSDVRLHQRSLTITTVSGGSLYFEEVERPKFIVTSEVEVYGTLDLTKSAPTEPHILVQNGKPVG